MNSNTTQTLYLLWQFFRRDLYVYGKQFRNYALNYIVLFPVMYAIAFAYLQAKTYFGHHDAQMGTMIFAGNVIIPLMVTAFFITFDLFFDLQRTKRISYQIIILPPRLILLQRIIFGWLFSFILSLPFYPIAKLLLRSNLDTSNTSWPAVVIMLACNSLFCISYHTLAAVVLKRPDQINGFWARINYPLITLGGFFIPRYIMHQFSPAFGRLMYFNPAMYMTDGLRQAFIGGDKFFSVWFCVAVLIGASVACTLLTWRAFKQRMDHI